MVRRIVKNKNCFNIMLGQSWEHLFGKPVGVETNAVHILMVVPSAFLCLKNEKECHLHDPSSWRNITQYWIGSSSLLGSRGMRTRGGTIRSTFRILFFLLSNCPLCHRSGCSALSLFASKRNLVFTSRQAPAMQYWLRWCTNIRHFWSRKKSALRKKI